MIDPIETKVMDINAEAIGTTPEMLMGNAGNAAAEEIERTYGDKVADKSIDIICGTGNNGGDGFVIADQLDRMGWKVRVLLVKGREAVRSDIARMYMDRIVGRIELVENVSADNLGDAKIIIDSMLGTGMSGSIREPFRAMILAINESDKIIVSIDIPSGLGADIAVKPNMTITFHEMKTGMNAENSGGIVVKDIGIPQEAVENIGLGDFAHYPIPAEGSHKGENGRLLIIGGGAYTGAPGLAGLAAFKAGVDLVTIATPENCFEPIASYSPNFIVKPLSGPSKTHISVSDIDELLELAEKNDAVLIGPGLGREEETMEAVRVFIVKVNKPVIIDADGLHAFSGNLNILQACESGGVLTPHSAEFQSLIEGEEDASILKLAHKTGFTVLLKGKIDLISDGQHTKKNHTGNPGMTVGGTGDVLAGLVGGLLAKGASPFAAARMGAFLCGAAGDVAFEKLRYSMMATDIIEEVAMVLKTCLRM